MWQVARRGHWLQAQPAHAHVMLDARRGRGKRLYTSANVSTVQFNKSPTRSSNQSRPNHIIVVDTKQLPIPLA